MAAFHSLAQACTKGIVGARSKLLKVLSDHMGAIDVNAVNHAGRALVHVACDPATYVQTSRRKLRRYHWNPPGPDESEFLERTRSFKVQSGFALKLLQRLARVGVDFNQPDRSGLLITRAHATACSSAAVGFESLNFPL
jgi:hypothetical protein